VSEQAKSTFNIDQLLRPEPGRRLRRLPRLVGRAMSLAWRAAPRELVTSGALQVGAGVGVAVQLLAGREVLQRVLESGGQGSFAAVLPVLALLAVVTALVSFANLGRIEQQRILSELVGRHSVNQVLKVATSVDLLAYERPGFHDRLQRAQLNAQMRPAQMATGVLGVISALSAIAGIGAALLFLQPVFLALVLLAYIPAWYATTRASKLVYQFSVEQTERDRRRAYLFRLLSGKEQAKEIRAFGLAGFLRERHDQLYEEKISDLRTMVRRRLRLGLLGGLATSGLTAATIAVLVWFVTTDRISLASAGAAVGAIILLGQRLRALSSSTGSLYESSLFLEDFTTFVEWMPALIAARPTAEPPQGFSSLSVDDVGFTYPSRREPSLRGVSMQVRAGEVVALVGENGSGKTTLAKLLAGLYTPDRGTICWDGVDTTSYDPDRLRSSVAVIFQDFVQYYLTARENIAMGRHQHFHDMDRITQAARQAGAHEYLESLDKGYETRLGPEFFGGSDLSVGQWQRVALARAFFRDAPFIILDEPTAALDPRAESELFESIRTLCAGRAVLLISHRFSSVRSADRIYVLRDGEVAEHGTHSDLMVAGGLYAELFTLQASAYVEVPT
jgi:ATP-binding cassette subfamily B protein